MKLDAPKNTGARVKNDMWRRSKQEDVVGALETLGTTWLIQFLFICQSYHLLMNIIRYFLQSKQAATNLIGSLRIFHPATATSHAETMCRHTSRSLAP